MELQELRNYVSAIAPGTPPRVFQLSNKREKIGVLKAFTEDKALVHIEGARLPSWFPINTLHKVI